MTNLRQASCACFRRQQRLIGHDAKIFGCIDARRVRFLHERFVYRNVSKLDLVFGLGLIVNDFNLGKFTNDKGKHVVHEMVKHGNRICSLCFRALLTKEKSILKRLLTLPFSIKRLRVLNRACTTWKHRVLARKECEADILTFVK